MKPRYSAEEIAELKQAYRVLGIPLEYSSLAIKRAYWQLAKKWHPDKWTSDPLRQQTAAERMKELNGAYAQIKHAPLRYHIETFPRVKYRASTTTETSSNVETMPVTDSLESFIRVICGFAFGLLIGLSLMPLEGLWLLIVIIPPLVCGYCALRFGDRFWHWVLEEAWLRW